MVLKQLNLKTGREIFPELRCFALTLNLYSPAAYNYVRKNLNICLLHPRRFDPWYSSINGSPGYTKEAMYAIKIKVEEMAKNGKKLICGLIMDEMAIKENIHFNGKRLQGFIDYGTGTDNLDGLPKTKEALVFLLVAINSNWKVPISYFLTCGLSSKEKHSIVLSNLKFIHETGVIIKSLTFDGAQNNISMANI